MKKFLKWTVITVIALGTLLFIAFKFLQYNTKKASPEEVVSYKKNGKDISVFYCRPYKKGRKIFGGLVPYDTVWRTGANEATTFTTNTDLDINGKKLPAGKYTLWTIPNQSEWTIIFNSKMYGWGVDMSARPSKEEEFDVLKVKVPSATRTDAVEQFTISFDETPTLSMNLAWDSVSVTVPIK